MSAQVSGTALNLAEFREPSGRVVRMRTDSADLSEHWFAWAELVPNGQATGPRAAAEGRGFMVGPRSAATLAVTAVLQGDVREEVRFAGGDFVVADGRDEAFGGWMGPWHAVYCWFPTGTATASVMGTFAGLEFVDDPLGVRITSRSERFRRVIVTKRIPNVGLMQIIERSEAAGVLPAAPGARVPAGEIWRKAVSHGDDGHSHEHLVFASSSAVAIMEADPDGLRFDSDIPKTPPAEADRLALRFFEGLVELAWEPK